MTTLAPRPQPTAGARPAPAPLPRRDPITELPLLILYPHSRCNCRCLMCDIWRDGERRELSRQVIERWLPEWKALGVRRVVLSGGEPLMHSEIDRLGEALRQAGLGVSLISTGLLLRRHARRLAGYCDDVIVSLDGPPAVHDRIRNVPRAFERLAAGVAALAAAGPAVTVTARCTVQRENFRHLRATVRAARRLGVDRISFLAADVTSTAFNRPDGWPPERAAEVALTAGELPALAAELDRLAIEMAAELERGFIAESPAKLRRRIYGHFAALAGAGELTPPRCNAPWVSTVIESDGTVRPCFFQPPLGNLNAGGSLGEILNAPAARAWRRGLDTRRDAICRRCVCSLELRRPQDAPAAADAPGPPPGPAAAGGRS